MKDLFDFSEECHCRRVGVIVDNSGRFDYCPCPDGVYEQEHDAGGFAAFIGKQARDVVSTLQSRLKELHLAH